MTRPHVVALAGGVGAARFLRGLVAVIDPPGVMAIVNTGDDVVLNALHVCPDLDTVTYTLAGAVHPDQGWGLADERWAVMDALDRFAGVRPAGSAAGITWFRLGDRDLATHLYRTQRLAEGATLSAVTAEVARAWGVGTHLVPMSDDPVRTRVTLASSGREVGFQDYFVGLRHDVAVEAVRFDGAADAKPAPGTIEALGEAGVIVICPSNPIVSLGPILAVPGFREALSARRDRVVAVSPIVGGRALKGPADRLLTELGHEASVVGVARFYSEVAATLVIDPADGHLAPAVEAAGMRALVTPTVMRGAPEAEALARAVLAAPAPPAQPAEPAEPAEPGA